VVVETLAAETGEVTVVVRVVAGSSRFTETQPVARLMTAAAARRERMFFMGGSVSAFKRGKAHATGVFWLHLLCNFRFFFVLMPLGGVAICKIERELDCKLHWSQRGLLPPQSSAN